MFTTIKPVKKGRGRANKSLLCFAAGLCILWTSCLTAWEEENKISLQAVESPSRSNFTVADAIGMTRIIDPDEAFAAYLNVSQGFNFSPDGRHFFMVTSRGNLKTGHNDAELVLYSSEEVVNFLNQKKIKVGRKVPEGKVLVRFSHGTNEKGIQHAKWSKDNRTVYFIGVDEQDGDKGHHAGSVSQLYSVDIYSKQLRQFTDHPRSVSAFDINPTAGKIIYASTVPFYSDAYDQSHYLVETRSIFELVDIDREIKWASPAQYYALEIGQKGPGRALGRSFVHHPYVGPEMWLSPDGHWAVAMLTPDHYRSDWMQSYQPIANLENFSEFDENTMMGSIDLFWQFALIDIQQGTVMPILDAPNGQFFGGGRADARWLPDGESVILANTFLPLDAKDAEENARRRQSPATVEYNIKTKKLTRIMEHVVPEGEIRATEWYAGLNLTDDAVLIVKRMNEGRAERKPLPDKVYQKIGNRWQEIEDGAAPVEMARHRLALSIRQDLNTPPDVLAHDKSTGREEIITDLNPQFRALTFGKVTLFEWTDKAKEDWVGGLVYPPDFAEGTRYPLMIQTHGFQKNHFLIEGPAALVGAYAAQALVNKGILVLQMPDRGRGADQREINRLGIEAAIDKLDEKGLINRQKVGLMGFSGTGHIVQHVITFSDYDFAAATIADAFGLSSAAYVNRYGESPPSMAHVEKLHQAVPWGDTLMDWVASNPVFHLDRVKTPLRLEFYKSLGPFGGWWDIYAILRRQQKPVEFLVIKDGRHNLVKPSERYLIQQGNVDWYAFWLKGEEDPDPAKAEQYRRWRKLCEQQENSELKAVRARKRAKEMALESKGVP